MSKHHKHRHREKSTHEQPRRVEIRDWCVGYIKDRHMQVGRVRKDGKPGYLSKPWEARDLSVLPRGFIVSLQRSVFAHVDEIPKHQKSFKTLLEPLRRGVAEGCRVAKCDLQLHGTRRMTFLNYEEKPAIEFLLLDFHKHKSSEFISRGKDGWPIMNAKGKPRKAVAKLAEYLRDRRDRVRRFERHSKALFRIVLPVFKSGAVWFAPVKPYRRKKRHHHN
jgi:hypothetical protein